MTASPLCVLGLLVVLGQQVPAGQQGPMHPSQSAVQKLGPDLYRVGRLRVDTKAREVSMDGTINPTHFLEFVAGTINGQKAYETMLALDTSGIALNTALLLIGLDPAHSRVPTRHFDPIPPAGDPVEVWVDWDQNGAHHHVHVEELLLDKRTNKPMPTGPWVYTGSRFNAQGYMADQDGVLIGFVHSPSPIIENPGAGAVDAFGQLILNPALGLDAGAKLTITIHALPR
jgi:hypothetical protein